MLDFDGTIAGLRRRPQDVRLPARTREMLGRLASLPGVAVAIISGRMIRDLQEKVGVEGVRYFGLHGAQKETGLVALRSEALRSLSQARREARTQLRGLPEIWIEDKNLSFVVHYRGAKPATIQVAELILLRILAPLRFALKNLKGDKVWEVAPKEMPGKGSAVRSLLGDLPEQAVAIYIGDDETDESAFEILPNAITVKVGRARSTRANFYVQNQGEVPRLLSMLEKELR
ncbi:MAG TPA: trehalose-phosphatase [Candidatus Limnocylindrales bacterium]|nr:trehalose-phosphatase [Candidatus Limnocylindrales bacterium]